MTTMTDVRTVRCQHCGFPRPLGEVRQGALVIVHKGRRITVFGGTTLLDCPQCGNTTVWRP